MTDENPQPTPYRPERMLDAGALRALAHPLRVQIYDILSQYGPQTASTLASMTGESSGSTSYHLRALAKHDLIREVDDRGTGRERWWERPKGGISFTNPEAMKTPSGKAATQVVMTEFLTRRHQQLMRYMATSLANPDVLDEEEAMISTATLRLTHEQTIELISHLQQVIDEFNTKYRDQKREGLRPISIRTDVFPLPEEGGAS
ncbi:MAG: transcriptional regulator [Microbacterium sp. SCN 70-200]|uniref:ArsR/SmtB family transcription factor n=1 Tax=unclassified Microbacterium TaxID=2609290 RepID=UPI00086A34B8|nr:MULTISPECIES: helix-turn-helix domain-containing protein [unclassified Microbacterium]MBN9214577.1 helix-turn-helix transcriptional regulator [Microbacterium sp.]ODT41469.1 MAG: transcriptional regulator [Microbacterium sp. SCN 70-200]OJV84051.1 MAG: transcriptional regulator [Microbacterium sp. 70-16]